MATIPVGYLQANYVFSGDTIDGEAHVTMGHALQVVAAPAAVAAQLEQIWQNEILVQQSAAITLERVDVKFGPNASGPSGSAPGGSAGGIAGNVTPANLSALITKHTLLGGRKGRGRTYLPGVPEANTGANGDLLALYVTNLTTAFSDFLGAVAAVDLPVYLLHGDETAPTEVEAFVVEVRPATQRRRLRRS